jgi:lipopolysaccharide/colanic/teichoic acid biosynthesis glycosyltransferase
VDASLRRRNGLAVDARDPSVDAALPDAPPHASLQPNGRWGDRAKRSFDLCAALVLIMSLAPLLAVLAITIKLQSRGPVLFRQTRLGRDGRPFEILKFRSMTVCETSGSIAQATREDARVTAIGRIMRRSSLDELAQVSGCRGATPELSDMQARIEKDIWYVRNRSFALDLHIIAKTVPKVLWDENAY